MPYVAHADLTLPQVKVIEDHEDLGAHARPSILVRNEPPIIDSESEEEYSELPEQKALLSKVEDAAPVLSTCQTSALSGPLPAAVEEVAPSPRSRLLDALRAGKEEEHRLRNAYEAEVVRGADLRAALEIQEKHHAAIVQWRAEHQIAEQGLADMMQQHDRCSMRLEDGQEKETEFCSRQARADDKESYRLRMGGPVANSELEESLRAADKEASELSQDIQRREEAIAHLSQDLRNVLEYMIKVNIRAAGGFGNHLTEEDFLPNGVRAHLGLGSYGEEHLDHLFRRYKMQMANDALSSPAESLQSQVAEALDAPVQQSEEPLMVAECQDEDDQNTTASWLGEESDERYRAPLQASLAPLPVSDMKIVMEGATGSLEEEGKLLQGALSSELNRFTRVITRDAESISHKGPAWDLLIAVTQGNIEAVRALLPMQARSRTKCNPIWQQALEKLGWTHFHLAAVNGDSNLIECLKEDMVDRLQHHRVALGTATSGTGLTPLGVACLAGHVEAAQRLLEGMAPVDVRDARGNTALHWAQMGGIEKEMMPLLLAAKADPQVCNRNGHRAQVKMLMQVAPSLQETNESGGVHLIRALALEPEVNLSFLSYTLSMLKTPVRDGLGFSKNSYAKRQAQLSADEEASGAWSAHVTNYTHAGLCSTLETSGVYSDPANWIRSRQALVLSCERVLLFNASSWSLEQVLALSELAELVLSSHCSTVVILRMHRMSDIVLDVPTSARTRLIEELQFATNAVNERWGGSDFSGGLRVHQEGEPITELFDQNRKKVGLLAWLEANVFLFLPYVPTAALLAGDSFFFGQLDLRQHFRGNEWGWRSYYFALKSGPVRKLLWCKRPTDELCAGVVHVRDITAVQPLDTPGGEICLIVEYRVNDRDDLLTLRAASLKSREDWIISIKTMQMSQISQMPLSSETSGL
ncbi:unnamed protein product [Durusdinium trenchii]|uniref:PH domain-containing protein n=2 Tax=Durusdinium trenchii TaxID=1381693 RepID=A0ABP0PXN7_9DINO